MQGLVIAMEFFVTLWKLAQGGAVIFLSILAQIAKAITFGLNDSINAFADSMVGSTNKALQGFRDYWSGADAAAASTDKVRAGVDELNNSLSQTGQKMDSVVEKITKAATAIHDELVKNTTTAIDKIKDKWLDIKFSGRPDWEKEAFNMEKQGVDPKIIERYKKESKALDELEKKKQQAGADKSAADAIMRSLETPKEKFERERAEIERLFQAGALDRNFADRAMAASQAELEKSGYYGKPPEVQGPSRELAGATEYGSREMYSNLAKNWAQMQGRNRPDEQTAKNTTDMKKGIDNLNKNIALLRNDQKNVQTLEIPA
jgi:hypothetical protein